MPSRLLSVLFGFALALSVVSPASAESITFDFAGRVTFADAPGVTEGDPFSGFFTFDSESVDDDPSADVGNYFSPATSPYGFTSFVNGVFLAETPGVLVATDDSIDGYLVASNSVPEAHGLYIEGDSSLLPNALLPLTPPSLLNPGIALAIWQYSNLSGPGVFIQGDLNTLTRRPANVPEPASLSLLLLGVGAVLARRGRRRTTRH